MIQFNLLPDVKIAYMKAQRLKRVVMVSAIGVTGFCLIILITFLTITKLQARKVASLDKEIKSIRNQLEATPDLNKILTIQNQLNNLTALHEKKPLASRLTDFLPQLTLSQIKYAKIELNMDETKLTFNGSADSLKTTNQFIDSLKFTKYIVAGEEEKNAFSEVVLNNFGRDERGASFEISMKFEPEIFNNTKQVSLKVPNATTTRSVTEKPGNLFQPLSDPDKKPAGQ